MGLLKKISSTAGKKAAKIVADKAEKFLSDEKNIEKVLKSEKVAKVTEKIKSANITDVAKKSVAVAKETFDIFKSQKVLAKLQ